VSEVPGFISSLKIIAVCSIVAQVMNGLRRNDVQPELLQLVSGRAASFELSAIRYQLCNMPYSGYLFVEILFNEPVFITDYYLY
jgi:hypothetical protein